MRCDVPLEILLAVGRFQPDSVVSRQGNARTDDQARQDGHEVASRMFETWSYKSDRPFSREALSQMVRRELPASVYRCKGIVFVSDTPDKRLALQIVGRRTI